jgi:mono/diheme cytochrome c family protein
MRVLAVIGALALIVAIAMGAYFLGGFYSVAATQDEPAFVKSILERTRMASITRHATIDPPVNLADDANVRGGARAFKSLGCTNCHGAPGVDWAKFSEGLKPDPPDLKDVVGDRTPQQLFWVVKNGINMTGMPSFAKAGASDDDIWKVVAYLKKLPNVAEADFKSWTAADLPTTP